MVLVLFAAKIISPKIRVNNIDKITLSVISQRTKIKEIIGTNATVAMLKTAEIAAKVRLPVKNKPNPMNNGMPINASISDIYAPVRLFCSIIKHRKRICQ